MMKTHETYTSPLQSSEPAYAFTEHPKMSKKGHGQQVRALTACALLGCMGFAMLIWYKLRVVTNVPRTAYAEPEQNDNEQNGNEQSAKTKDSSTKNSSPKQASGHDHTHATNSP
jgi:hypothetical protein